MYSVKTLPCEINRNRLLFYFITSRGEMFGDDMSRWALIICGQLLIGGKVIKWLFGCLKEQNWMFFKVLLLRLFIYIINIINGQKRVRVPLIKKIKKRICLHANVITTANVSLNVSLVKHLYCTFITRWRFRG